MAPLGTNVQVKTIAKGKSTIESLKKNLHGKEEEGESCNYKLTIRIDKIKSRPGPKCKKNALKIAARAKAVAEINKMIDDYLKGKNKIMKNMKIRENINDYLQRKEKMVNAQKLNANVEKVNGNIKKPYYQQKNIEKQNENFSCLICSKTYVNEQSLLEHKKQIHFICRICEISCGNKASCHVHENLHSSPNQSFPFKCHLCVQIFKYKQVLQSHNKRLHSNNFKVFGSAAKIDSNNIEINKDPQPPVVAPPRETGSTSKPFKLLRDSSGNLSIVSTGSHQNSSPEFLNSLKTLAGNLLSKPSLQQEILKLTASSKAEKNSTSPQPLKLLRNLSITPSFKLCKLCNQYVKMNEMPRHTADHLSRAFPCLVCNKLFISAGSLTAHMKTHETK